MNRAILVLFNNIITDCGIFPVSGLRNPLPYSLQNKMLIINLPVPRASGSASFFVVKYSSLWIKLLKNGAYSHCQ